MKQGERKAIHLEKDAINRTLELLNRRWVMRIIWELRDAPLTFRALQASCSEISPSVLNQRIKELRQAGVVEHIEATGYGLTVSGHELLTAFKPIMHWSFKWFSHG